MSKILRAVIVMRDAQDIQLDQYVLCDGGDEHVARVTFNDGAIEHAFDHVARWFRESIACIERERELDEERRRRDADVAAGMTKICGYGSPYKNVEDVFGPTAATELREELFELAAEAALKSNTLPDSVREKLDAVVARIGERALRNERGGAR